MSLLSVEASKEPLAAATKRVLETFPQIIQAFNLNPSIVSLTPQVALTDALERFQLWLGSVGATIDGHKEISLEWRLKDAPGIRNEIFRILGNISEELDDLHPYVTGEKENQTRDAETIDISEDPASSEEIVNLPAVDEVQNILDAIVECVRGLLRLSVLIRKASPRDRWMKAMHKQYNNSFDDSYDVGHVGEKFPKLRRPENEWLQARLGRAITQRRQFIRYCRQHKEKLSGENVNPYSVAPDTNYLPPVEGDVGEDQSAAPVNRTVNSVSQGTRASTLHQDIVETMRHDTEDDDISTTSTFVSFIDSTDEDDVKIQLPTLDTVSNSHDQFECPLCFTLQSFKDGKRWKRHAFKDLKPYVCTMGKGECDLKIFADRKTWFKHELEYHRHIWICTVCDRDPFDSVTKFRAHVHSKHKEIPVDYTSSYASVCKSPSTHLPAADCPFCDDFESRLREAEMKQGTIASQDRRAILVPASRFSRHLASHMEQLAFFAIGPSLTSDALPQSSSHVSQENPPVKDAEILGRYLNSENLAELESTASSTARQLRRGPRTIYLLEYSKSGLIRLGFTQRDIEERKAQWESRCGLETTLVFEQKGVWNARRVDRLVRKELQPFQTREKFCKCKVRHRDLYDAPCEEVIKSVTKWIDFVSQDLHESDEDPQEEWQSHRSRPSIESKESSNGSVDDLQQELNSSMGESINSMDELEVESNGSVDEVQTELVDSSNRTTDGEADSK